MKRKTTRHSRALVLMVAWMALFGAICAAPASAADDTSAIRALIGKTWDTPDAKVVTDPVVVDGGHALASWTHGERGGRALLHKRQHGWAVVLCSGDPLKTAAVLMEAGVPKASAEKIAADLAAAEAQTDPRRVKLFATFEGVMHLDGTDDRHHQHESLH